MVPYINFRGGSSLLVLLSQEFNDEVMKLHACRTCESPPKAVLMQLGVWGAHGVWGETPEANANLEVLSSKTPVLMSINQIKKPVKLSKIYTFFKGELRSKFFFWKSVYVPFLFSVEKFFLKKKAIKMGVLDLLIVLRWSPLLASNKHRRGDPCHTALRYFLLHTARTATTKIQTSLIYFTKYT